MGFFKSKKGSIISDYFCIEEDLGQFKKGDAVDVALYEDHLELQKGVGNKDVATLAYSQITDVFYRCSSCSAGRQLCFLYSAGRKRRSGEFSSSSAMCLRMGRNLS